MGLCKIYIDK